MNKSISELALRSMITLFPYLARAVMHVSDVPVCFAQFVQYAAKFFPTKFNPLFLIITDGSERKRFAASYYCDQQGFAKAKA